MPSYRAYSVQKGRRVDVPALFEAAMGRRNGEAGYADYFDFNADGIIDALDDLEFMRRLLRRA